MPKTENKFRCGHTKKGRNVYRYKNHVECRKCRNKASRKWQHSHPEYQVLKNKEYREEQVKKLMKSQKRKCPICNKKMKHPYRDHDHSCCPVNKRGGCKKCRRGLLCPSCNSALHLIENKKLHKAAKNYLQKWKKETQ